MMLQDLAVHDSDVEKRFRAEYPAAFERLKTSVSNFECRIRGVSKVFKIVNGERVPPAERSVDEDRYHCFAKGLFPRLSYLEIVERGQWARVWCETPDHEFRLISSPSEGLYIQTFSQRQINNDANPFGSVLAFTAMMDDGIPIADMLKDPSFVVIKASEILRDDDSLVELNYMRNESVPVLERRMVLRPRLNWAFAEGEVAFTHNDGQTTRRTTHVDYMEGSDGVVFPNRREIIRHTYNAQGDEIEMGIGQTDFIGVAFGAVSDDRFTLASFGLAPPNLSQKPTETLPTAGDSWLRWAVFAMSVLAAILLLAGFRLSKRLYVNSRGHGS